MMDALDAVTYVYFTRALGWTQDETRVLLAQVRKEFSDRSLHLYTYCWFYTARKPMSKTG